MMVFAKLLLLLELIELGREEKKDNVDDDDDDDNLGKNAVAVVAYQEVVANERSVNSSIRIVVAAN